MHTIEHKGARIHYNSDLSGDVIVQQADGKSVEVPGELVVKLMWRAQVLLVESTSSTCPEMEQK